jgi:hypothetical protein
VLKNIDVFLSRVHVLQQFPEMIPLYFIPIKLGMVLALHVEKKEEGRKDMATRFRRKKIQQAAIRDPIRAAYVLAYVSPVSVATGPPDCDVGRLRTFFYKVCELITDEANFVDAVDILNDMKLALQSHVEYYRDEEYRDFLRILTAIETRILPAIQANDPSFDTSDLQADIGYVQLVMKHIYVPETDSHAQSNCQGSEHPSDRNSEFHSDLHSNFHSDRHTDHTSEHSSQRGAEVYTHKSSMRVSRMILRILHCIVSSIELADVIRFTQTFITHIEVTYYKYQYIERIQDKVISMIGNINHGVHPGIIEMRVNHIKELLDACVRTN